MDCFNKWFKQFLSNYVKTIIILSLKRNMLQFNREAGNSGCLYQV